MCDYSLMAVPNRLAEEGERLVSHRFPTGAIGLAAPGDVWKLRARSDPAASCLWKRLWSAITLCNAGHRVTAVCIPPGARLLLEAIPKRVQRPLDVGITEEVTFTQLSLQQNQYRDAVRFKNGQELLIQELEEETRVYVLDLGSSEHRKTMVETGYEYTLIPRRK
jgi:hypothetical protein